jgi:hypothetical protein
MLTISFAVYVVVAFVIMIYLFFEESVDVAAAKGVLWPLLFAKTCWKVLLGKL